MILRLFLLCFLIHSSVSEINEAELLRRNPNWVQPDAWGLKEASLRGAVVQAPTEEAPTEPPPTITSQHVILRYRQLVRLLFNSRKFKADPVEPGKVHRTISIKLTQDQLDKMLKMVDDTEQTKDLSDEVLKVFEDLKEGVAEIVVDEIQNFCEMVKFTLNHIFSNRDVKFFGWATLFVLIGFVISKFTRLNFFMTLLIMAFVLHFSIKYIECNQKKQIEEIIKFKRNGGTNPCMKIDTESSSIFERLTWNSNAEKCFQYMRESANVDMGACQPIEVLGNYFADIFINANARIIQSTVDKCGSLINEQGYFRGILIVGIFAFISFGLLKDLVGTIATSFIRYGIFGSSANSPLPPPPPQSNSGIEEFKEVLRENTLHNQKLVASFLQAQTLRQNETAASTVQPIEAAESNDDLPESMTRRSSESIEVIPESLAGDEDEDFEVIKD